MLELVKKVGEVDINRLLNELDSELKYKKYELKQISLQGFDEADFNGACGKTTELQGKETDCVVRLYQKYNYTYEIIEKYKMYRSRIMMLPDKRNYGWHIDYSPRIHIPLITNVHCFFIIENEKIHLPADGSIYWVDTQKWHTFVNANRYDFMRSHLVGCV